MGVLAVGIHCCVGNARTWRTFIHARFVDNVAVASASNCILRNLCHAGGRTVMSVYWAICNNPALLL
jgi:hypothetical protein